MSYRDGTDPAKLFPRCAVSITFGLLLGVAACRSARAEMPSTTPTDKFLCSAGPRDGQACNTDADCASAGVCVIAQGVCDGGTVDGLPCDCAGGTCRATPVCSTDATLGTCSGGQNATECCDLTTNCSGGNPCVGAQRVCLDGENMGFACLHDSQCPSSMCRSTGKFWLG